MNRYLVFALALLLGLWTEAVRAHEGEDHGPPAVVNARPLLPRVTAHSELFELVGVLEPGGRLLLWLDATPTNAPVEGAVVEVEGAGANGQAAEVSPGVYELKLDQAPAPGSHPLTFTVQAGSDMDLLGAPLVVARAEGAGQGAAVVAGETSPRAAWAGPVGWMALGAVGMAVAMAGVSALRRRRALPARR
ncbi:hypothetical protein [uncultured Azohydromonas sp.]|jgi:hypothetical protein|uniref:hypothetical protein n=1 Tax=uncultured Azohydromonas sp. TaxID=487342 RepID=UPI0026192906|nr:hypothetical protein [uncultured Azohydromonas sp.]